MSTKASDRSSNDSMLSIPTANFAMRSWCASVRTSSGDNRGKRAMRSLLRGMRAQEDWRMVTGVQRAQGRDRPEVTPGLDLRHTAEAVEAGEDRHPTLALPATILQKHAQETVASGSPAPVATTPAWTRRSFVPTKCQSPSNNIASSRCASTRSRRALRNPSFSATFSVESMCTATNEHPGLRQSQSAPPPGDSHLKLRNITTPQENLLHTDDDAACSNGGVPMVRAQGTRQLRMRSKEVVCVLAYPSSLLDAGNVRPSAQFLSEAPFPAQTPQIPLLDSSQAEFPRATQGHSKSDHSGGTNNAGPGSRPPDGASVTPRPLLQKL